MRFPWLLPVLAVFGGLAACRSDATAPGSAPAASASNDLDTTPLGGAPTAASIAGWWLVVSGHQGNNDDPGSRAGSAWWFGPDSLRLLVGDANDRRPIERTRVEGDALRLELEGDDLLVTRRRNGIAVRTADETARVPLRRATPAEVKEIEAADKKRGRMLERACEKALECCNAARSRGIAKENDCLPLLGKPDLAMCIQAVAVYKNKAIAAQTTIPECLPDK